MPEVKTYLQLAAISRILYNQTLDTLNGNPEKGFYFNTAVLSFLDYLDKFEPVIINEDH